MARTIGKPLMSLKMSLKMSLDIQKEKDEKERIKNINKVLKLMSQTINYISHPSLTNMLECNINFKQFSNILMDILLKEPRVLLKDLVNINNDTIEILLRSYLNIKFERNAGLLIFKDTEALKILHVLIVMINESEHPLYQCYHNWISGENWMTDSMSLFPLINYKLNK